MSQCEVVHPVDETRCMTGDNHGGKHKHWNDPNKDWKESYLTVHNIKVKS